MLRRQQSFREEQEAKKAMIADYHQTKLLLEQVPTHWLTIALCDFVGRQRQRQLEEEAFARELRLRKDRMLSNKARSEYR